MFLDTATVIKTMFFLGKHSPWYNPDYYHFCIPESARFSESLEQSDEKPEHAFLTERLVTEGCWFEFVGR